MLKHRKIYQSQLILKSIWRLWKAFAHHKGRKADGAYAGRPRIGVQVGSNQAAASAAGTQ